MDYHTLPLLCDQSAHQDKKETPLNVNWRLAKLRGMVGAKVRVVVNGVVDRNFTYNWEQTRRKGLLNGGYNYFEWITGVMKSPEEQRYSFFNEIAKTGHDGNMKPAIDFERPGALWPELPDRDTCHRYLRAFRDDDVEFYSNRATIEHMMPIEDWLLEKPLWISNPPYAKNTNRMCKTIDELPEVYNPWIGPWDKWTFWQWTFKLNGLYYGAESLDLDGDFYNGTLDDLLKYCNLSQMPTAEPGEKITGIGTVLANGLNVRSSPVVGASNFLYSMPIGTAFEIAELRAVGSNEWARLADTEHWCAVNYSGNVYVSIRNVPEDLPPVPGEPTLEDRVKKLEEQMDETRNAVARLLLNI